ncbi:MAG TPA: L-serine ammonia-lyase [Burkholderiales bacterium]|nr:L-serine ammonia-lyase [Burkholderiales bacterium]
MSFVSVLDLFKIGIGPSSSHTVGPMRAAKRFATALADGGLLERVRKIHVDLYGSLGATGKGHGTDKALILGLQGDEPDTVDVESIESRLRAVRESGRIELLGHSAIPFDDKDDLQFRRRETLPLHPNGMRFQAFGADQQILLARDYYSVGGGFVVGENSLIEDAASQPPYPFANAAELLDICNRENLAISDVVLANELKFRRKEELYDGIAKIWSAMQRCIERGCATPGVLPGGLKVKRRAPELFARLTARAAGTDPLAALDWVSLWAMAVNEENAAGGRVVTAPTNGAAGIIPAVVMYYVRFCKPDAAAEDIARFFLTATAIGSLYKRNASISGADVGCQGEVGVACSMAAAALTELLGGSPSQVENAAEIAMEHHLGLTCDPIGGLVQIPCIERNAMGTAKAISASRLALHGDGQHYVSLDNVIKTMRETGADMHTKYKETSRGGLALHVVEC